MASRRGCAAALLRRRDGLGGPFRVAVRVQRGQWVTVVDLWFQVEEVLSKNFTPDPPRFPGSGLIHLILFAHPFQDALERGQIRILHGAAVRRCPRGACGVC